MGGTPVFVSLGRRLTPSSTQPNEKASNGSQNIKKAKAKKRKSKAKSKTKKRNKDMTLDELDFLDNDCDVFGLESKKTNSNLVSLQGKSTKGFQKKARIIKSGSK